MDSGPWLPSEATIRADERRRVNKIIRTDERQRVLRLVQKYMKPSRSMMILLQKKLESADRHEG